MTKTAREDLSKTQKLPCLEDIEAALRAAGPEEDYVIAHHEFEASHPVVVGPTTSIADHRRGCRDTVEFPCITL